MKKNNPKFKIATLFLTLSLGLFWFAKTSQAASYYVDPSFTGGGNNGSETNPWTRLNQAAQWDTIDNALASDAVTVYLSARQAQSDIAETTNIGIFLRRTDGSTNLLTINGRSKYNVNDSIGSWLDYAGTNKFTVQTSGTASGVYANLSGIYTKRNHITIDGIKVITDHAGQSIYVGGDYFTITNCEVTQTTSGSTSGGGIGFGYAKTVSGDWYGSCSNVVISNNYIHDVGGEGIYIGGCGNAPCAAAHNNITISGNTIRDVGVDIGQPDGIDIKDGNSNITVSNNTIYMTNVLAKQGDGIVTESAATIERNFIYNFPRSGIFLSEYWDTNIGYRNGPIIRNNIIVNTSGGYVSEGANGITIYAVDGRDNWSNVKVYNNTIYGISGNPGNGIRFYSAGTDITSGHEVVNNIIARCSGREFRSSAYFTFTTHDYNNYYDTSGTIYTYGSVSVAYDGNLAAQETNSIKTDPLFLSTWPPYQAINFKLQTGSSAIDAGTPLIGFFNDYVGLTRPIGVAWDIGAYEYVGATLPLDITPPAPPSGVMIL
jgi:hypothetical protein